MLKLLAENVRANISDYSAFRGVHFEDIGHLIEAQAFGVKFDRLFEVRNG